MTAANTSHLGTPAINTDLATISIWVRPTDSATADFLFSIGDTASDNFRTYIALGEGTSTLTNEAVFLAGKNSGSVTNIVGVESTALKSLLYDGYWHHFALVLNGSYKFYVDGVPYTTTVGDPGGGSDDGAWALSTYTGARIGAIVTTSTSYYTGKVDDVRLYNRALSPNMLRSFILKYLN